MSQHSVILVPTDFSHVAECAIVHASVIAHKSGDEVKLLHVIKESKGEHEEVDLRIKLEAKLESQCTYYGEKYGVRFDYIIREGSIFTTIGEVSDEIRASLILMGTHGVKGVQHITGAWALRVIATSKVPVIVVQNKLPQHEDEYRILAPIDDTIESKQKTSHTITLAKTMNARVYLFDAHSDDEAFENRVKHNAAFIKRHLEENEIRDIEAEQENKNGDFAKDFIKYAKDISADLIVIVTTADKGIKDFFLGPIEQQIINNDEQIPVMCVNPLQRIYKVERLKGISGHAF